MEKQFGLKKNILLQTAFCESSLYENPCGITGDCDNGKSVGILQWQRQTWEWQKLLALADGLEVGNLDINNSYNQILLAGYSFSKGYASHWSCYRNLASRR